MQEPATNEGPGEARKEGDALIEAEFGGGGSADGGFGLRDCWRWRAREGLEGVERGGNSLRGMVPFPIWVSGCAGKQPRGGKSYQGNLTSQCKNTATRNSSITSVIK